MNRILCQVKIGNFQQTHPFPYLENDEGCYAILESDDPKKEDIKIPLHKTLVEKLPDGFQALNYKGVIEIRP